MFLQYHALLWGNFRIVIPSPASPPPPQFRREEREKAKHVFLSFFFLSIACVKREVGRKGEDMIPNTGERERLLSCFSPSRGPVITGRMEEEEEEEEEEEKEEEEEEEETPCTG